MALEDLVMPKLGESIMEATILKWLKQVGDAVEMDETVLEIATDKVDSEVPSTASGIIEAILFNENDVVPIGTVIARIRTAGTAGDTVIPEAAPAPQPEQVIAAQDQEAEVVSSTIKPEPSGSAAARFYSPLVLNIAASEGISMSELEQIPGTGKEGRVTKNDILDYVANRSRQQAPAAAVTPPAVTVAPATQTPQPGTLDISRHGGNVEIIEMDRMRKLIAEHMVRSKQTSPHVTSFSEADVTNMVMWREKVKKDFEKREGTKITFMPLFIEAITRCIKRFPLINSSIEGDKIIIKKDINIGMATALPSGNLIVPVIKNADQLNLTGLAKRVNGLADAARNNKLKAEDTQGGTFTITNVGTFGSLAGTPIINQPQVAILAVGAIKKRPVVVETPQGDSIAIRHMMVLSMSYDHRVVDGALGATFLSAVAKELESFVPIEI
ncbi:2-oxo acid dehydrogenase subunit E2 [Niabella pedocola]|uniref:Dihydrolipoamide acetyltransferase component of pyruvate dehydrogenase complex n=1 Tax=Niabella pedocola TaxID=1752077 RepID=A0ABS8PKL4_9BACT|nr:dihydrolipoamide acetyltransferase family protein [Niabella pedocola]MCD2421279.1 2-oxo acid dehydrogenase subunit E2 [Niabella pedocola]